MTHEVHFTPEAQEQLAALYRYLAAQASPATAQRYTTAIVDHCATLSRFPHRCTPRDDIRPGLRVTNYKRRSIIAFHIDEVERRVVIDGVFYGGQDYETNFQDSGE